MVQPDEIIRSNRKTLAISVDSFGRLIVRAPKKCGQERIFAFLTANEAWILRKQKQAKENAVQLPPNTDGELGGYAFPLLGKSCKIRLTDNANITFDATEHALCLPRKNAKKRLIQWLKENGKRIFSEQAAVLAERMGVSYRSFEVGSARGKWGSCTYDNRLRFTFRLLYAPRECIEYVIVHELAHIKHKNHSPRFWSEVERFCPDWKARRKVLKTHGLWLQIF